jgi:FG-GAP-like repeat/Secretion system C-terminal sorting domain
MRLLSVLFALTFLSTNCVAQFGPEIPITVQNQHPHDATAFDMDLDGDFDILYSAESGNYPEQQHIIGWFEQIPGGQIRHKIAHDFPLYGYYPSDLDQDGDVDLVAGSENQVVWFENLGDNDSWVMRTVNESFTPGVMRTADFDQDGDLDIVTAAFEGMVWFEQEGAEWLPHNLLLSDADGLETIDFDLDGDIDIVGSMDHPQPVVYWWENIEGEFTAHVIEDEVITAVFPVDVDSDGDMDVMAAGDDIVVYTNTPEGWSRELVYEFPPGGYEAGSSGVADLEGDGDYDFVVLNRYSQDYGDPSVYIIRKNGDAWNWEVATVGMPAPRDLSLADFDSDGLVDFLTSSYDFNQIAWLKQHQNWWEKMPVDGRLLRFTTHQTLDWDGDGDTDFLGITKDPNRIVWYEHDGEHWIVHYITDMLPEIGYVDSGDIDGDGDRDVIAIGNHRRTLAWYEAQGEQYIPHVIDNAWHEPQYNSFDNVVLGDLDEDSDLELVVYRSDLLVGYDRVGDSWGRELLAEIPHTSLDLDAGQAELVDMDQDGDLDLVTGFNGFRCYENTETHWIEHIVFDGTGGTHQLEIGDIDNDGDTDVAIDKNNLKIYMNLGDFAFNIIDLVMWVDAFDIADIDGDQDLDIVCSYWNGGDNDDDRLSQFEWTGDHYEESILDFSERHKIFFSDYEGDGDPDLFVSISGGFSWWENLYNNGAAGFGIAQLMIVEDEEGALPGSNELYKPYPNPFNASTTISVGLPMEAHVSLIVYNVTGREVARLAGGMLSAGKHRFVLDGSSLPSGLYFVRADFSDRVSQVRKLMLVK